MKKLLIATAALAMVAGTVQAQSSVTVSGRLDLGYSDKSTNAASAGDVKTKEIKPSPFATSFLRLSGSEDLGGGLKANFLVETGTSGTATTIGDRGLWAELNGSFGSLRAGTQNSMSRDVWTGFAQTGSINIVGDLNSSTAEDAGGTSGVEGFTTAVKYTTPVMSGFSASALVSKATTDSVTGVKSGSNGSSFAVNYNAGKLNAMAGKSSSTARTAAVDGVTALYYVAASGLVSTVSQANGLIRAAVTAADAYETKTDTTAVAASYDFGVAKAALTYVDKEAKRDNTTTTGAIDRKSTTLSVQAPIGKTTVFASYGIGSQVTGNNGYKGDLEAMQVGIKQNFSKRTFGYLATGTVEHELSASTKNKNSETAVGIVHLF